MESKIISIDNLLKELEPLRQTKKIGLISGCFDILHAGHLDLFQFAKDNVDILIVGIDADAALKKTKGETRPINDQKFRARMLAAIEYIDYVLLLSNTHEFGTEEAKDYYANLVATVKPTHLITAQSTDSYWERKKNQIEALGGHLLVYTVKNPISTSTIYEKILSLKSTS